MKNPFSTTTLCWCLSLLLVFHGCASYTVSPAPIPTLGAMPVWQTRDLVAVGADPYAEPDRQQSIFAADLIGKTGVVPIQVLVQNQGPRPIKVRRSEITLEFPETRLSPVDASRVVEMLMGRAPRASIKDVDPGPQSASARSVWVPADITFIPIAVFLAPIWIPIAIVASVSKVPEAKEREGRLADYQAKEFQDAILDTNTAARGFVYFYPRLFYADPLREATLVVRVADAEDESHFTDFRLRLSR